MNELRQARDLWLIPVLESQKLLLEGSLQDAERAAQVMLGQKGLSTNAQMTALALLFLIRREQGRHGELADGLRSFAYQSITVTLARRSRAGLQSHAAHLLVDCRRWTGVRNVL